MDDNKTREDQRRSRFYKFSPHELFKEYDYSLWVDGNININSNLLKERVDKLISDGATIGVIEHPDRECIYDEAEACVLLNKDKKEIIDRHVDFLKEKGYPHNAGLSANYLMFRKHNDTSCTNAMNDWLYMQQNFSVRDQLSLYYALWKNKIIPKPLLKRGDLKPKKNMPYAFNSHNKNIYGKQ